MVHRVVQVTSGGLITKGDNNTEPDQYMHEIANGPITQQCLEGKVIFVIPYVELLAYEIDAYGLPQWFNYLPSVLILIIVMVSIMGEEEDKDEEEETSAQTARTS